MLNCGVFQSNTSAPAGQYEPADVPDVSVVIVNWNVRDLLVKCVQAVLQQAQDSELSTEIIVVDNASADDSVEAATKLGVSVIANDHNVGYGAANNMGFAASRGRYLLVLNPDTVACPGSIAALYQFADRNPRAGIVAPRLLNPDGTVQRSAFRFPTLAMAANDLFAPPTWLPGRVRSWIATSKLNGRYPHEPVRRRPFRCDHPLGAAMLLSRGAVKTCGGFDPAMFMYAEEIDLALRFNAAGFSCWQVPSAEVVHLGGQSTSQVPGPMIIELWRSRLYLYHKHRSRLAHFALRVLLASAMCSRIAFERMGRAQDNDSEGKRRERLDVWRRVYRLALGGGRG
jgi:N-acetylglucosaminyl-diphospho-decaprenol L-rhamnosyltransferase